MTRHKLEFDKPALILAVLYLCGLLGTGFAQGIVTTYFDLDELSDIPGVVQVSTDYLTIIEFEGYDVERANTARADLYTLEIVENTVVIRANEDVINTDLFARVAGRTVLFRLESDPTTNNPRRYVVREQPELTRSIERQNSAGGATRPDRAGVAEAAPLFPLGLQFEAEVLQFRQNEIIIQYRLINESRHPIVNDPLRLRIYYGDTSIYRQVERSPVPGRPNFLAPGEAEAGQILIPKAPYSLADIELEWALIEVGPGTQHLLIRNLGELAELGPGSRSSQLAGAAPAPESTTLTQTPDVTADSPAPVTEAAQETAASAETEAATDAAAADAADDPAEAAQTANFVDSDFTADAGDWYVWLAPDSGAEAEGSMIDGEYCVAVTDEGEKRWHVRFALGGLRLPNAHSYLLRYDAYTDATFDMGTGLILDAPPFTDYSWHDQTLSGDKTTFEHDFVLEKEDGDVMLLFLIGDDENQDTPGAPYRVCFDNIQLVSLGPAGPTGLASDEASAEADSSDETRDDEPADVSSSSSGGESETEQILVSSSFEDNNVEAWRLYVDERFAAASQYGTAGEACIAVERSGDKMWMVSTDQTDLSLRAGKRYTLSFDAYADQPVGFISIVGLQKEPWTSYHEVYETLQLNKKGYSYSFEVPRDNPESRLIFLIGGENVQRSDYEVCLDNIKLSETELASAEPTADVGSEANGEASDAAPEVLIQSDFESSIEDAWIFYVHDSAEATVDAVNGEACFTVTQTGKEFYRIGFVQLNQVLKAGQDYTFEFEAHADQPVTVSASVSLQEEPWTTYQGQRETLQANKQSYSYSFTMPNDEDKARVIFEMGGEGNAGLDPYTLCLDNVYLGTASRAQEVSGPTALFIVDSEEASSVDTALAGRLGALGYQVSVKDDNDVSADDAANQGLVIISASVDRDVIDAMFRDTPVPVVTFEEWIFAPLGLTGPAPDADFQAVEDVAQIQVAAPEHPLSAGLSGDLTVSEAPAQIAWGVPSEAAVVVATLPGEPAKATIFAYEAGAQMVDTAAPARRVGLFYDYEGVTYNDDALALFDAAVQWAAGPAVGTAQTNIVSNAEFTDASGEPWKLNFNKDSAAQAEAGVVSGEYCVHLSDPGAENDSVRLVQASLGLPRGDYTLRFDAYADKPVKLGFWTRPEGEGKSYVGKREQLSTAPQTYEVAFAQDLADNQDSRVVFDFVNKDTRAQAPYRVCLDNVVISSNAGPTVQQGKPSTQGDTTNHEQATAAETETEVAAEANEVLLSSVFEEAEEPWQLGVAQEAEADSEVLDGEYCVTIRKPGSENWHVNLKAYSVPLEAGKRYTLSWRGRSERPVIVRSKFIQGTEPWGTYAGWETTLGSSSVTHTHSFSADTGDPEAILEFQMGADYSAGDLPVRLCFDDIRVSLDATVTATTPAPSPTFTSTLVARHSQLCLNVPESGDELSSIAQGACAEAVQQSFDFYPVEGADNVFSIVNQASGKCISIADSGQDNGVAVVQATCKGAANQQFELQALDEGFRLVALHSGRCLDVAGVSVDAGAPLQQYGCRGAEEERNAGNQTFLLNGRS